MRNTRTNLRVINRKNKTKKINHETKEIQLRLMNKASLYLFTPPEVLGGDAEASGGMKTLHPLALAAPHNSRARRKDKTSAGGVETRSNMACLVNVHQIVGVCRSPSLRPVPVKSGGKVMSLVGASASSSSLSRHVVSSSSSLSSSFACNANRRRGRALSVRASAVGDDGEVVTSATFDPPWSAPGYRGAVVSSLPEWAQAASVLAAWAGIGALTTYACGTLGPTINDAFPGFMTWSRSTWPVLGLTYVAAGAAHFGVHQGFVDMFPHRNAWGFFNLPGTPSFHVNWTGAAEILGGVGIASALLPLDTPEWITPTAAWGIFLLTVAVTPANTYMWTHNAPGPLPENADESMVRRREGGATGGCQPCNMNLYFT